MTDGAASTGLDVFSMLMDSLTWPADVMQEFKRNQLAQLLRHAKANVPFYKTRLDCVVKPDGSIDWSRWNEIPILTRAELQKNKKQMIARRLPPGHGPTRRFFSSGSTGVPVEVVSTHLAISVQMALVSRYFTLRGVDPMGRRAQFWFKPPKGYAFKNDVTWLTPTTSGQDGGTLIGNRKLSFAGWLNLLEEHRISIFNEFATTMVQLAHENLQRKKRVHLDAVIPYGMGLSAAEYDLLAESFGAKVIVPYSSKEGGLIAFSCGHGSNFHVCEEAVHCEYQDADHTGDDEKEIIITPIFSSAQPLIRYRQGDIVMPGSGCSCGIKLPVLRRIVGRADDVFHLAGHPVPVVGISDGLVIQHLKASAFQIAQTGENDLEVRFVSQTKATPIARRVLTHHIRRALSHPVVVSYSRRNELPLTLGGKQKRFTREWQQT